MQIATKTLETIESALAADQGAAFRGFLGKLIPLAGDAYSTKQDDWRDHLGASLIGRECARELWYSFHWATLKKFEGRMLRLFNRGHLEEPRFCALLEMIGCQVFQIDANGKQFRITGHKGHFGGSLDAVVIGIPDLPGEAVLAEFKTHGEKSFTKLVAGGVVIAKPEHFYQMQTYMGKYNLSWAIYFAVNKNTDEIHAELVQFNEVAYERCLSRSAMIIDSATPPPGISTSPGFFKCKYCSEKGVCHKVGKYQIAENCRTCINSRIADEGKWVCVISDSHVELSPNMQRIGCPSYKVNPVI